MVEFLEGEVHHLLLIIIMFSQVAPRMGNILFFAQMRAFARKRFCVQLGIYSLQKVRNYSLKLNTFTNGGSEK